jgi:hypothetical protein
MMSLELGSKLTESTQIFMIVEFFFTFLYIEREES